MKRMAVLVAMLAMACGGDTTDPDPLRVVANTRDSWIEAGPNAWVSNPSEAWCVDSQVTLSVSLRDMLPTLALHSYVGGRLSDVPACNTGAVICGPKECNVGFRCCGPVPPGNYTIQAQIEVGDGTARGAGIVIFAR